MAFEIFLSDGFNVVELDTENIDLKSVYSLIDISNIGARKDNIKTLTFKGTKTNNNVFGSFFDFGRTTDTAIPNKLLFNYNPLRTVDVFVYENSTLLFKGTLRLNEINVDVNGSIIYNTIVTGAFIDLKTALQDRYLQDLNFDDLEHYYHFDVVKETWNGYLQNTGTTGGSYMLAPGKYVYPLIDYGYTGITNDFNAYNFRPALYLREYFNRIFNQTVLSGFTYEIKGSNDFIEMFDSIIVPDTQESFKQKVTVTNPSTYSMPTGTTVTNIYVGHLRDTDIPVNVLNLGQIDLVNVTDATTLTFKQDATIPVKLILNLNCVNVSTTDSATIKVRLLKNGASVVEEQIYLSPAGGGISNITKDVILNLSSLECNVGDTLKVNVIGDGWSYVDSVGLFHAAWTWTVYSSSLYLPYTGSSIVTPVFSLYTLTQFVTPVAPINVKQIDFLKSVISQFNFIVYTTIENPKKLIFETFDDFYYLTNPLILKYNSLDWSNKIDYTKGLKFKSNLDLPKSYIFTTKTDIDYLTDKYKKRFNKEYGSLNFDDSLGLQETKKLEVIFSPTIISTPNGTDIKVPLLYKVDSNVKKQTKTNIRLMFFNGMQSCNTWRVWNIEPSGVNTTYFTGNTYPQASNYYLKNGVPVFDLNFGLPYEFYFTPTSDYIAAPTAYSMFYSNQITNITNPNVVYIECNVHLNEIDIANLDFKIPIYINTGGMNGAYFKLLKVEYDGSETVSKILLQKIGF